MGIDSNCDDGKVSVSNICAACNFIHSYYYGILIIKYTIFSKKKKNLLVLHNI